MKNVAFLFLPHYDKAKEQAKLHLEFDMELASGALDDYVSKVGSSKVRMIIYTYVPANVALFISA